MSTVIKIPLLTQIIAGIIPQFIYNPQIKPVYLFIFITLFSRSNPIQGKLSISLGRLTWKVSHSMVSHTRHFRLQHFNSSSIE